MKLSTLQKQVVKPKEGRVDGWTEEEKARAKHLLKDYSIKETAEILGRSYNAVMKMNSKEFHVNKKYSWTEEEKEKAKQLLENHTLQETAKILGKSHKSVEIMNSRELHVDKNSDKGLDRIRPNLEISEPLSYILGVLKGDGSVPRTGNTYKVKLGVVSYTFCKNFRDSLVRIGFPQYKISEYSRYGNRKRSYVVQGTSNAFGKWYKSLSLDDIWSMIKDDKYLMLAFLRGFYESEGSYRPIGITMYNTDNNLIELVSKILNKLKYDHSIYKKWLRTVFGEGHVYTIYIKGGLSERNRFINEVNPCIKNS